MISAAAPIDLSTGAMASSANMHDAGTQAEGIPEEGIWAWMLEDTLRRATRRQPPKHLVILGQ